MTKKLTSIILLQFALFQSLFAQAAEGDFMRSTGKIYVVVAVILIMFIGIVIFLTILDKRLTKLENQIHKQ